MAPISVSVIPTNRRLRSRAAAWSLKAWRDSFPSDTMQWYLNLYKTGDFRAGLPITVAATIDSKIIGIGSLVTDDELPGAAEQGPWLAAVYVSPKYRRHGAGRMIVHELLDHAVALGYEEVFAYTETKLNWYQKMDWEFLRTANVANHEVSVIKKSLY